MGSLVGIFLVWAVIASAIGCAFAYVEGRVNQTPPRWLSCILLSVFLGVIGWVILAMRSGLSYSSATRNDQRATAEAVRQMAANQAANQAPGKDV